MNQYSIQELLLQLLWGAAFEPLAKSVANPIAVNVPRTGGQLRKRSKRQKRRTSHILQDQACRMPVWVMFAL